MPHRLSLVFALLFSLPCFAQELFEQNWSVRAAGMGGAYVSAARGGESLFYNPANLSFDTGYYWTIADIGLGAAGVEALDNLNGLTDSASFASTLSQLYGQNIYLGGYGRTMLTLPNFAAAYYYSANGGFSIDNPAVPEMTVNYITDTGYALGTGFNILPGFQMGLTLKRIKRIGSRSTLGTSYLISLDPAAIQAELEKTGVAYSLDLGFNIMPLKSGPIRPIVSFVYKDLGQTSFRATDTVDAPPSDQENMILGAALEVDAGLISMMPIFEMRYLNNSDIDLSKKLHLGVELGLPLIDIRAGLHQGYYTAGVGLGLGPLDIQAATYGVERGAYAGQIEDRRYVLSLKLELGFSSEFSLLSQSKSGGKGGSGSGTNSRLKRRR